MPAEVTNSRIIPALGHEVITITDDFGTDFTLQIPVSDSTYRQARIDDKVKQQSDKQAAIEGYAASHKIDLTAAKAEGVAKKAKLKGTK